MSKRYCIFSAQYLPHMGGVERYTYNIAKGLSDNGDKVTIEQIILCRVAAMKKRRG